MSGWKLSSLVIALVLAACAGEAPKEEARSRPAPARAAPAQTASKPEPAKPEPAKPAAKPEPAKPEPSKPEPAKPEPVKPEPAKPEPAKPAPAPKPEPGKLAAEPTKPAPEQAKPARPKTEEELLAEVEAKMALEDVGDPRTLGGKPIRGPETDEDRIERLKRQALVLDAGQDLAGASEGGAQQVRSRVRASGDPAQRVVARANAAIDAGRWDAYAACFTSDAQRAMAAEMGLLLCAGLAAFEQKGDQQNAAMVTGFLDEMGISRAFARQVGASFLDVKGEEALAVWARSYDQIRERMRDPRATIVKLYAFLATAAEFDIFLLLDGHLEPQGGGGVAVATSRARPPLRVRVVGQGDRQQVDFEADAYLANFMETMVAFDRRRKSR